MVLYWEEDKWHIWFFDQHYTAQFLVAPDFGHQMHQMSNDGRRFRCKRRVVYYHSDSIMARCWWCALKRKNSVLQRIMILARKQAIPSISNACILERTRFWSFRWGSLKSNPLPSYPQEEQWRHVSVKKAFNAHCKLYSTRKNTRTRICQSSLKTFLALASHIAKLKNLNAILCYFIIVYNRDVKMYQMGCSGSLFLSFCSPS